jgi:NADPH:quinone reductase-like Zn-dependent oxidoreductase
MRALVATGDSRTPLEMLDLEEPTAAPGAATVEVRAMAINRGELRLLASRPKGWRPGQDIAGIVVKQAADGTGPAAGTRVVALCDWEGWAERAGVPSHRIAPLADNVSFAQAASLPVAGLTALRALRHGAPLLGKRVLITGAAGGVGNLAVQLAARSGARVTAIVGNTERAHVLDGLGAAEIVTRIEDTEGRFALILESAGGASLKAAIERIDHRGTVVIFGNSSGEPAELNFRDFAEHQNARIQAFHYFTSEPEERFGADLGLLAGLIADGTLKPRIVEHGWRELPRTGPRLLARQIPGKAIFLIDQK